MPLEVRASQSRQFTFRDKCFDSKEKSHPRTDRCLELKHYIQYLKFRQHAERDESKAKVKERAKNETKANELKFGAPSPTRNPDGGQDAIKIAMGRSKKPGA